jgi:hypothetical protein
VVSAQSWVLHINECTGEQFKKRRNAAILNTDNDFEGFARVLHVNLHQPALAA